MRSPLDEFIEWEKGLILFHQAQHQYEKRARPYKVSYVLLEMKVQRKVNRPMLLEIIIEDVMRYCGQETSDLFMNKEWVLFNLEIMLAGISFVCCYFLWLGWDDGKIRAFTPESGKLLYAIDNAHQIGVTAVATTNSSDSSSRKIISGGGEGEVRVWLVRNRQWNLQGAMKEKHKGRDTTNSSVKSWK